MPAAVRVADREVVAAIERAALAPWSPARGVGCCRVYVTVGREHARAAAAACKRLGWIFQRRAHYGLSNAIYVGYDNCDGRALGRGQALISALACDGVTAHLEVCGD